MEQALSSTLKTIHKIGKQMMQDTLQRVLEISNEILPSSIGVCLGGSAADDLFLPGSDLDIYLVGDGALDVTPALECALDRLDSVVPIEVTPFEISQLDDPYLRGVLWLRKTPALQHKVVSVQTMPETLRLHRLEAALERQALLQRPWSVQPGRLRTHPNGLRAAWTARSFGNTLQHDTTLWQALAHLKTLHWLDHHGPQTDSPSTWVGPAWKTVLTIADTDMRNQIALNLTARIGRLLERQLIEPETLSDPVTWKTFTTAWHGKRDELQFATQSTQRKNAPLIAMGLAFNRETPPNLLFDLLTSAPQRPLLRRRIYTHRRLVEMTPDSMNRFWMHARNTERIPRLCRLLDQRLT